MDGERFDFLARDVASTGTRRRMIGSIAGATLALLGFRGVQGRACSAPGVTCREGANCCSGLCGPADARGRRHCICPPGQEACDGACVEPDAYNFDPLNCGSCGHRCPRDTCNVAACNCGDCGFDPDPDRFGSTCDDGNPCTENDLCRENGSCAGTEIDCPEPRACEESGICNSSTGKCEYAVKSSQDVCRPASGPCDVDDYCDGTNRDCGTDNGVPDGQRGGCDEGWTCQDRVCTCTPKQCSDYPNKACGELPDGCGSTIDCGGCNFINMGQVCVDNYCGCENGAAPCSGFEYCVNPTDSTTDICLGIGGYTTDEPANACEDSGDCRSGWFCATSYRFTSPVCMQAL
jgi:hypothetical protein